MHIPSAIARRLSVSLALALTSSIALTGCGGGGNSSTTPAVTGPSATVTVAEVAPLLATSIASSITAALQAGFSTTASTARSEGALAAVLRWLGPVPLYAQTSNFVANCSRGGNVNIRYFGARNRVALSNTDIVFSGCGHTFRGADVLFSGTLRGTGTWTAGDPGAVQSNGELNHNSIGLTTVACFVIGDGCNGTIGGIRVGTLDTPPPPNPNTCPGVLSITNVQAGPAGGAFSVDLTVGGTCPWTASSGAGFVTITGGASGRGNGTVSFTVAANSGAQRTGSITVNGMSVTITQAGVGPSADDAVGRWAGIVLGQNPCSVGNPTGTYAWTGTITKSGTTFTMVWRDAYFESNHTVSFPATSAFNFVITDGRDTFRLSGQFASNWQSLTGTLASTINCVTSIRTGTGTWQGARTGS